MLVGELSEKAFLISNVASALFILFMFLVIILLENVLIAIVTDSYKVIQDQRAAIVFWTNRLDFIAEMDAIAKFFGCGHSDGSKSIQSENIFGKEAWKQIMDLFEDGVEEGAASLDFVIYTLLRIIAVCTVALWLVLGVVTAGWLWPPQVREGIFTSTVFKHSSDVEMENELRRTQVKQLQEEVRLLNDELLQELAVDRNQVVQLKSHITERKTEIANEMRQIKRIVTMLFERQASFQG
jgi:hypothetical protein